MARPSRRLEPSETTGHRASFWGCSVLARFKIGGLRSRKRDVEYSARRWKTGKVERAASVGGVLTGCETDFLRLADASRHGHAIQVCGYLRYRRSLAVHLRCTLRGAITHVHSGWQSNCISAYPRSRNEYLAATAGGRSASSAHKIPQRPNVCFRMVAGRKAVGIFARPEQDRRSDDEQFPPAIKAWQKFRVRWEIGILSGTESGRVRPTGNSGTKPLGRRMNSMRSATNSPHLCLLISNPCPSISCLLLQNARRGILC